MEKFTLNRRLSEDSNADPEDVMNVKRALNAAGYYLIPDLGLADFPDKAMFEGIARFQTSRGLTVDRVMKPGGATEQELNTVLASGKKGKQQGQRKAQEKRTGECARIEAEITELEELLRQTEHTIVIAKLREEKQNVERLERRHNEFRRQLAKAIRELRNSCGISRSSKYLNFLDRL